MKEDNNISVHDRSSAKLANDRYEDQNFVDTTKPVWNYSILYDNDINNFQNGTVILFEPNLL